MKKTNLFKNPIAISLLPLGLIAPTILLSSACKKQPVILLKNNENFVYDENSKEWKVKGSARAFRDNMLLNLNPVAEDDPAYELYKFKVDSDGKYIYKTDSNGQKQRIVSLVDGIPEANDTINPTKFKNLYSDILDFKEFFSKYEYRVYAYTNVELQKYFPSVFSSSRYAKYRNRTNVLFMSIFYIPKYRLIDYGKAPYPADAEVLENELTVDPKWKEYLDQGFNLFSDVDKSKMDSRNPGITGYHNYLEYAWPFFPLKSESKTWTLKDYTDPIVIPFETD